VFGMIKGSRQNSCSQCRIGFWESLDYCQASAQVGSPLRFKGSQREPL
jgi:hypothetical protein